jgi:Ca2+-transporting ATPase
MTGDGINDGPALKAADIGVAMGKDGAELARQVADVLLVEDDVHALVPAIAQGRAIYDDIGKSIHFIVATNLSETLFMLSSAALGLGLPLGPKQLLWINLLTDVFPELALAVEPPESDVLARPPRDPAVPLVSPADFRRIGVESTLITGAALGGYLYGRRRYGAGPKAGTVAFMTITGAQLLHAISSRSESHSVFDLGRLPPNRYISMAVGGGFAVQVLAAGLASVRHLLGTSRISIGDGLVSGGCAILSFAANEALKVLRRSRTRGPRDGRAGLGRGSERNPT